jgi:hypothetical protein
MTEVSLSTQLPLLGKVFLTKKPPAGLREEEPTEGTGTGERESPARPVYFTPTSLKSLSGT